MTKAFANEWASKGGNENAIASGYSRETIPQQYGQTRSVPVKSWNGFPLDVGAAPGDLSCAVFLASRASDYGTGMCWLSTWLVEPLIPKTITMASILIPR